MKKEGCGSLANVADNNAALTRPIVASGGIDTVLGAMVGNEGVQKEGCFVLWSLAMSHNLSHDKRVCNLIYQLQDKHVQKNENSSMLDENCTGNQEY